MLSEGRVNRVNKDSLRYTNEEKVEVYSATFNFQKDLNRSSKINYGVESYFNDVDSKASKYNIYSEEIDISQTRFPNGTNKYLSNAIFSSYSNNINERLLFSTGLRYELLYNKSTFSQTPLIDLPFKQIEFTNTGIVGNIGINYHEKNWSLSYLFSKGYRAPNLDDFGKIRVKNDFITLPTNNLKPEETYSNETRFNLHSKRLKLEVGMFCTYLVNTITRVNGNINGIDSLFFEGAINKIQFNTNTNKGIIYGSHIKFSYQLNKKITFYSNNTCTYGLDITEKIPLGHIPPFYGKTGINYRNKFLQLELNSTYNLEKKASFYSPNGVDNLEFATAVGTPNWYLLNLNASYDFENIRIVAGVDNILDKHVRLFSSGISKPGINFWLKIALNIE